MQNINVKKNELFNTLTQNREDHLATYTKAVIGFREAVTIRLKKMLEDVEKGKKVEQYVGLIEPVSNVKEYDKAIRMVYMSVDDTIALSEEDFEKYILDEWHWKNAFKASTMHYTNQ